MSTWHKMYNAHVIVFAYKRPQHLKMTLERLALAEGASATSVTIFVDGPKCDLEKDLVQDSHDIAEQNYGFASKNVIRAKYNLGLAKSITDGVSEVLKYKERVIVLEDDILIGCGFLNYMNKALHRYESSNQVFSISGYVVPEIGKEIEQMSGEASSAFAPRCGSWGWATWRRAWQDAQWAAPTDTIAIDNTVWPIDVCGNDIKHMLKLQHEGLIDSWAVLWVMHHFVSGGLCLYPSKSFVENIGLDGSGTNCGTTQRFNTDSKGFDINVNWPGELSVAPRVLNAFRNVYNRRPGSYLKWPVLRLLKRLGIS